MQDCQSCHQPQTEQWLKSDHAKAMMEPSLNAIVADISQSYSDAYHNQFYISQQAHGFFANITEQGNYEQLKIEKTFGYYPLQQYLVAGPGGRLQVLPYSWDARPKAQGGQRWFYIYQDIVSEVNTRHRYHWAQPLQNWNGMCADCHSSGLQRHYDVASNQFNTQWREINVGCLSCHTEHSAAFTPSAKPVGAWQRKRGESVARWVGDAQPPGRVDVCFSCHSLREPLSDGFTASGVYLDKHKPLWPMPPFYYPDGQIKDEVYVYGSFMQSKMAQAGVTCLDCHDSHTMQLKSQGDGLCLSCHALEQYYSSEHSKHQLNAAECVDCHMPTSTYMGVDARRDHSFLVPNARLSHQYGSPDTCLSCHANKDADWSIRSYQNLYGLVAPRSQSAHVLALALAGQLSDYSLLWTVIHDQSLPDIRRASAIALLPQVYTTVPGQQLVASLGSSKPLIRLAAVQVGGLLSNRDKLKYLPGLLADERKAIRIEAANQLVAVPLPPKWQAAFSAAFEALVQVNDISSWRAEGLLNHANLALRSQQVSQAERLYHLAIERDPYFDQSYIELAELYRALGEQGKEAAVYKKASALGIASASFKFSLGLYYIRQHNLSESLQALEQAVQAEPDNSHYLYVYLLGLKKAHQVQAYKHWLKQAKQRFANEPRFKAL